MLYKTMSCRGILELKLNIWTYVKTESTYTYMLLHSDNSNATFTSPIVTEKKTEQVVEK